MSSWYSFQFFPQISRYYSSGSNYYWYNLHFRFHIRCISIHKLLYFNFFLFFIIIIIIIIISFMQGIYTYIPETKYVPREYIVAAVLLLLFMVLISLASVLNLLYFYISTFQSMCAVPSMAVFWSFIIIIIIISSSSSIIHRYPYACYLLLRLNRAPDIN